MKEKKNYPIKIESACAENSLALEIGVYLKNNNMKEKSLERKHRNKRNHKLKKEEKEEKNKEKE